MKQKFYSFVVVLNLCVYSCLGQSFSDVFQSLQTTSGVEFSEDEIASLQELYANPLNLNHIREQDCATFIFLNEFEQKSLWDFLTHNRPLQSIYEVQLVLGLPIDKAQLLAVFSYVNNEKPPLTTAELLQRGKHTLAFSYSFPQVNFAEWQDFMKYEGNPDKEVVRYRFNSFNQLTAGVTLKNDAGERFYRQNRNVFDYKSAYVAHSGKRADFIAGDYELQVAQGLTVSQGGFFGKSIDRSVRATLLQAKVHSSANEFDFFRGAIARFYFPHIEITPFVSFRQIDGKAKADSTFPFQLYKTGYRRTATEIENRNAVNVQTYGTHIASNTGSLSYSLTSLLHNFSLDTMQHTMVNTSTSFRYGKPKFALFGELAFDKLWHYAVCVGTQIKIHQDFLYTCIVRSFSNEYQSFMTHSFAEQSTVKNETGVYNSFDLQLTNSLLLSVAHDVFYMPAERYFVKNATRGRESRAQIQYSTYGGLRSYINFRSERKTDYTSGEQTKGTIEKHRNYVTIYLKLPLNEQIYLTSSWHQSFIRKYEKIKGFAVYQDIVFKPVKVLKLFVRYAQFNADYDARLSAWEENVQYAYSSQSYFYEGSQCATVVEYNYKKRLYVEGKCSKTFYRHPETLPAHYSLYKNSNPVAYNFFVAYKF